jgi:hypothetical protein
MLASESERDIAAAKDEAVGISQGSHIHLCKACHSNQIANSKSKKPA